MFIFLIFTASSLCWAFVSWKFCGEFWIKKGDSYLMAQVQGRSLRVDQWLVSLVLNSLLWRKFRKDCFCQRCPEKKDFQQGKYQFITNLCNCSKPCWLPMSSWPLSPMLQEVFSTKNKVNLDLFYQTISLVCFKYQNLRLQRLKLFLQSFDSNCATLQQVQSCNCVEYVKFKDKE